MQRQQDGGSHDILLTGSNGFLGSQFVTAWLQRHPASRAACLVRALDDDAADARLKAALLQAGEDRDAQTGLDEAVGRAAAIRGVLGDPDAGWIDDVARWRDGSDRPLRVVHCAANLSFRPSDRDAVRAVNIDGTRFMLDAASRLGASEFNYVSTAYVAGDREGLILEDVVGGEPPGFSNAYEESKWEAEALVRDHCARTGLLFRILRPSIIIGHSVTYRLSALSGFYKVIETMLALGRMPRTRGRVILLPVPRGSTLDLIPVDTVVAEMMALLDAGPSTLGHAFHLTSDTPLPLVGVLDALSPLAGLTIGQTDEGPVDKLADLVMQRLRHYAPYLGQIRHFDRRNVRAAGIAPQPLFDVEALRPYVTSFIGHTA